MHARGEGIERFTNLLVFMALQSKQRIQFEEYSFIPYGLVWNTNMAAVSLCWYTNMAGVTSCENAL